MSQSIALLVLDYLHTTGTTQKELAELIGVSPAYIAKVLKGGENLSLETICKLQEATGVKLMSVSMPYTSEMIVVLPPSPAESSVTLQLKEVA
jgi:transcriptional regulator with XRE-family HTH domain